MALNLYLSGTDVTLTVPMTDSLGNALAVNSVSYYVTDMNENVIVPATALGSFTALDAVASITVPGADNTITDPPAANAITSAQIDQFNTRELRTVVLECLLSSGNTVVLKQSYGIEHPDPLTVGLNSFLTLPNAELLSLDMTGLSAWSGASDQEKIGALITARQRICQLNFWLLNSNTNWGQDNMNYVPEGAYQTPYASAGQNNMFIFNGNLGLLTPKQFSNLPARFQTALKYGQVAEADFLLGGSDTLKKRQEGMILDEIGDVKQMYRAAKPLDLPVSKKTLWYLSAFVTFSKRIGRG